MGSPVDLSRKRQRPEISVHPRVVLFKKDSDDVKETTSEQSPRYGMTSVCGLRREMEDAVSIWPDFLKHGASKHSFFGVFDGHGCSHVAAWCKNRMHEMLEDEVDQLESGLPPSPMEWKGVMDRSFSRMDAEVVIWGGAAGERRNTTCRCELQTPKCEHVGSTAVVAVVGPEHIVVANCGDSRAVLCRQGAAIPLSIDHKPDRPDEMQRIQAAGGRVIFWDGPRVQGVLAMSRAIGDGYLKPYVTAEPEVTVTERKEEDEFLILASDGLWDVVTNETACQIVRMCLLNSSRRGEVKSDVSAETSDKACSDAATLLTKMALARRSADNVSVVVVDLRMKL